MKKDSALDVAIAVVILGVIAIAMTGGLALFIIPWPFWLIVPIVAFFLVSWWEENEGGTGIK